MGIHQGWYARSIRICLSMSQSISQKLKKHWEDMTLFAMGREGDYFSIVSARQRGTLYFWLPKAIVPNLYGLGVQWGREGNLPIAHASWTAMAYCSCKFNCVRMHWPATHTAQFQMGHDPVAAKAQGLGTPDLRNCLHPHITAIKFILPNMWSPNQILPKSELNFLEE